MAIAKKPPPPSSETISENGRWRSEKLNFTDAGVASKGRLNPAPSERFFSAKTPTARAGSVSE
jgi:hypothetical protein